MRLLAEASAEIGLSRGVQELCTVCAQTLRSFTPAVPPCVTDLQAVEAFMALVTASVVAMLDTHVPDPSTRYRLRKALSEACQREALLRA